MTDNIPADIENHVNLSAKYGIYIYIYVSQHFFPKHNAIPLNGVRMTEATSQWLRAKNTGKSMKAMLGRM